MSAIPIPIPAPWPACFGVACPTHGRCLRYAAVSGSAADPKTIDTCRVGERFPLFLPLVVPLLGPLPLSQHPQPSETATSAHKAAA